LAQLDAPRGSFPSKVGTQKALGRQFTVVQVNGLLFWGVVAQICVL
jgi:hypothetical protein